MSDDCSVVAPTWDAVILSSAAVVAAAIAARTANRRMANQLDAESRRLRVQLAHDLEKHDRSELREILDEGSKLILETWDCFRAMDEETSLDEEAMARRLGQDGELVPAVEVAPEHLDALGDYWQRLMLRFNVFDVMTTSVESMMETFRSALVIYGDPLKKMSEETHLQFAQLMEDFEDARAEFVGACQERFGVKDFVIGRAVPVHAGDDASNPQSDKDPTYRPS